MTNQPHAAARSQKRSASGINFQSLRRISNAVDTLALTRDDQNAIINMSGARWTKRTIYGETFDNFQTTSPTPIEQGKVRKGESAWCVVDADNLLHIAPTQRELDRMVIDVLLDEIAAFVELGKSLAAGI